MIHPISTQATLPAGLAGPEPLDLDVRCFLVGHATGLVLIDTGLPGTPETIGARLAESGAGWADLSDVILTHGHYDHIGGLDQVRRLAPQAVVWGGPGEDLPGLVRPAEEGGVLRGLRVLATPGHTPGHISLLLEADGTLFPGDLAGSEDGRAVRPPEVFTADHDLAEQSLLRLAALDAVRLAPSHGPGLPGGALRTLLATA